MQSSASASPQHAEQLNQQPLPTIAMEKGKDFQPSFLWRRRKDPSERIISGRGRQGRKEEGSKDARKTGKLEMGKKGKRRGGSWGTRGGRDEPHCKVSSGQTSLKQMVFLVQEPCQFLAICRNIDTIQTFSSDLQAA